MPLLPQAQFIMIFPFLVQTRGFKRLENLSWFIIPNSFQGCYPCVGAEQTLLFRKFATKFKTIQDYESIDSKGFVGQRGD